MWQVFVGGVLGWGTWEYMHEGPWVVTTRGVNVVLDQRFGRVRWANMRLVPRVLIHDANVRAMLAVIREKESAGDYRAIVFGGQFQSFADHPRIGRRRGDGRITTAAGAYQIVASTWDGVKRDMELMDFGPASQDMAALGLIAYRGALPAVVEGKFDDAVRRLTLEWTSLPGAAEDGWRRQGGIESARAFYVSRGGKLNNGAVRTGTP